MSSLLGEAIVDAKALRTSALKNAESTIIEKYSDEVKKTLEQLLEQEEEAMEMPAPDADLAVPDVAPLPEDPMGETPEAIPVTEDDIPLAATDGLAENEGHNLSDLPDGGEDIEVTIDLGALQESIEALADSLDEDIEVSLTLDEDFEETIEEVDVTVDDEADEEEADSKAMAGLANLDEDSINTEDIIDAVMEKLNVDTGFELSGWAGRPTSQLKLGQQRALAGAASTPTETTDEEVELDPQLELNESITELEDENNSLKAQLDKYKHAIGEIKENLYEVNLSNARLLYTNRVLRNSSLNERQKDKIVEAISTAGSVTEAKTIFDTLQSTVEAKPSRQSPQSLSEAIGRRSSVIRATRQESSQPSDSFSDRMRRLAGIK